MFKRLAQGISRTRDSLLGGLKAVLGRKTRIDEATLETLESTLLVADCGVETTARIIDSIKSRGQDGDKALISFVADEMTEMLRAAEAPLAPSKQTNGPFIILVVGVNGAGKTTTIAKMGRRFKNSGLSVMFAAGDTFADSNLSDGGTRKSETSGEEIRRKCAARDDAHRRRHDGAKRAVASDTIPRTN